MIKRKTILVCLVMYVMWLAPVFSQDAGRDTGFGIRLTGEMTTKMKGVHYEFVGDTFFAFVPNSGFQGMQLGGFYKAFLHQSQAFVEAQVGLYYMGQKRSSFFLFWDNGTPPEKYVDNYDIDEWGTTGSIVAGYNFPIGNKFSLDVFTGPELRAAFSCKNDQGKDMLDWHYNRWLMRWKLGTGFNYRHVGVQLYGSYDVTKKSKQVNTRDFTLSLGLGYKF